MIAFQFRESLRGERVTLPSLDLYNKLHMAKTIIHEKRELEAGYHIYQQPTEGGEMVIVRRKVAMPTDVEHRSSKETRRQRERFTQASKAWAKIPSIVKADMQDNYGIVDVQKPHGKSDIEVLQGRQLFIAQEIHQEKYHQEHQELPPYVCIVLRDERGNTIYLLGYLAYGPDLWHLTYCNSYYLSLGNTLFYPIPFAWYYLIGCSQSGGFTRQIFSHNRNEILEVRYKTVYPYLYQWCSYVPLCYTYPPSPNWKLSPYPILPALWRYEVHQPTEEVAYPSTDKYFPETAYTLTWEKINQTELRLTILLGSLRRPDRLTLGPRYNEDIVWTITPEGILDPPQHACRINIPLWHLLSYG